MIKCIETNVELKSGKAFAVGRLHDPKRFPVSSEVVRKIPKKERSEMVERYRTGGMNVYSATVSGENGDSEFSCRNFLFSVPLKKVRVLFPKAAKEFNFPGEEVQCFR